MKTLFAVLLLAGASFFAADASAADAPARERFPSDYKPQPCAPTAEAVCESFPLRKLTDYAVAFRGFDLESEWVDKHWNEMREAFLPICAKMGNCFTVAQNDWVYCLDIQRDEMLATCDRYPAGSEDREQCTMFAMTYYIGLGAKTELHREAQNCIAGTAAEERTLEVWMTPQTIGPDFDGKLTIYAVDAETRIPVRARYSIDGPGELRSTEGPIPTAGYTAIWKPQLKRVPNAEGHQDVVVPTATLEAKGYKPYTLTMPMAVSKMIVEMSPAAHQLKRGKNSVTITARDSETGKPVEARVMAGEYVLGDTNKPLELEIARGKKRPEIWVTSLYDRYSDVIVAPAQ